MITKRTITSDYKDGIGIRKEIEKKEVFKWRENTDNAIGLKEASYIYATEEVRKKHIKEMIKDGWTIEDEEEYMTIYKDDKDTTKNITLPYGLFEKNIPNVYGEVYGNEDYEFPLYNVEDIIESRDITNFLDIEVFKTFSKFIEDEELAIEKAMEYKKYIATTENRYPELIMRFLRYNKFSNEYNFEKDDIINKIEEDEVFNMLQDFQNKFGNLSDSVLEWIEYKYKKKLD